MSKIIDVIEHKNAYGTQTFLVLDRMPEFKYERVGDFLSANDGGFFDFYEFKRSSDAFCGRKFNIPMVGGGYEEASGQWWDSVPSDYNGLLCSVGVGTRESLGECNVFTSVKVDFEVIKDWLSRNESTNNYHKYDKKSLNYGIQSITSKFGAVYERRYGN